MGHGESLAELANAVAEGPSHKSLTSPAKSLPSAAPAKGMAS
jgi:hypothetical protein